MNAFELSSLNSALLASLWLAAPAMPLQAAGNAPTVPPGQARKLEQAATPVAPPKIARFPTPLARRPLNAPRPAAALSPAKAEPSATAVIQRYPLPQAAEAPKGAPAIVQVPTPVADRDWDEVVVLSRRIRQEESAIKALLDPVAGDSKKLSAAEQARVDQHLRAWREAEEALYRALGHSDKGSPAP